MSPNFAMVIGFLTGPGIAHVLDWLPSWNSQNVVFKQLVSTALTAGGAWLAYFLTANTNASTVAQYDPLIGVSITLGGWLLGQLWHKYTKATPTTPTKGG